MSQAEELLAKQITLLKLPEPVRELRFAAEHVGVGKGLRKRLELAELKDWRFDFAWPELMLAVEVEGGGWTGGRHTRGKGFEGDLQKYGKAQEFGWTVYRCSPAMVKSGQATRTIAKLISLQEAA